MKIKIRNKHINAVVQPFARVSNTGKENENINIGKLGTDKRSFSNIEKTTKSSKPKVSFSDKVETNHLSNKEMNDDKSEVCPFESKRMISSKPITLKRIKRYHENRCKIEEINEKVLALKREKEINQKLSERVQYLEKQLKLFRGMCVELLKHKLQLCTSSNDLEHGSTNTTKGIWLSKGENIIGWKLASELSQETRVRLMDQLVKKYKQKLVMKTMIAKQILELVQNSQE